MAKYVRKAVSTVFLVGLLVLAILSVIGMVYLTQMAFSDAKLSNGKYVGNLTAAQRDIARIAILALWLQFAWIVLGSFLQPIWYN